MGRMRACVQAVRRSLPTRGAWIEITTLRSSGMGRSESLPTRGAWIEITRKHTSRRSPHGERGLKCLMPEIQTIPALSLPTRGAWIEIIIGANVPIICAGRSPHGERGLKSMTAIPLADGKVSLPTRGAWIEMSRGTRSPRSYSRSPHGERGLKLSGIAQICRLQAVAPHTGSVD